MVNQMIRPLQLIFMFSDEDRMPLAGGGQVAAQQVESALRGDEFEGLAVVIQTLLDAPGPGRGGESDVHETDGLL